MSDIKQQAHGLISAYGYRDQTANDINISAQGMAKLHALFEKHFIEKHCEAVGTWLMLNTDLSVEKICDAEQAIREA